MPLPTTEARVTDTANPVALHNTFRDFIFGEFRDANGDACSIQESSVAAEPLLWLGMNTGTHVEGMCLARMHLTQDHVRALLPLLQHFAEHGCLPENG